MIVPFPFLSANIHTPPPPSCKHCLHVFCQFCHMLPGIHQDMNKSNIASIPCHYTMHQATRSQIYSKGRQRTIKVASAT